MAAHTNVTRLVDRIRTTARALSDAMSAAKAVEAEATRVGGEARLSPYFFTEDATPVERTDLPFSLADLTASLSAFKVLSAGASPVEGMAAQVDAAWASIDKIKV